MHFWEEPSSETPSPWDMLGDLSHVITSEFPDESDPENNHVRIAIRLLREYNELRERKDVGMGITVWYKQPYGPDGEKRYTFQEGTTFEADADGNLTIYDKTDSAIGQISSGTYVQVAIDGLSEVHEGAREKHRELVRLAQLAKHEADAPVPGSFTVSAGLADEAEEHDDIETAHRRVRKP